MPTGFRGNPATAFFAQVDKALCEASAAHSKDPFARLSARRGRVPLPRLPRRFNQENPYPPATAQSGGFNVGKGTSDNIVVDYNDYLDISANVRQADDDMGVVLHRVATQLEALCDGAYILPQTGLRCKAITTGLKNELPRYQALTEDALAELRTYANIILEIG
jgi:hypothetical protein